MSEITLEPILILSIIFIAAIKSMLFNTNDTSIKKKELENPRPPMISVAHALELVDKAVSSATTIVLSKFQADKAPIMIDDTPSSDNIPTAFQKKFDDLTVVIADNRAEILSLKSDQNAMTQQEIIKD